MNILTKDITSSIAVTCVTDGDMDQYKRAHYISNKLGCRLLKRPKFSLSLTLEHFNLQAVLVVGKNQIIFQTAEEQLQHHPNASVLRISNIDAGRGDVLTDLMELKSGDRVLDCTCGMGADAITSAHQTGDAGYVLALESSPILSLLTREGMSSYNHPNHPAVTQAMRRVHVKTAYYQEILPNLADNTFDVIYFDPMFPQSFEASNGLQLVRLLAHFDTPKIDHIIHAQRIARRAVFIKDSKPGRTLNQLGFKPIKRGRRFLYGKINCSK